MKSALRKRWLATPTVFRDLLQKYGSALPSDATLRFDLIGRGFSPASAETTLQILKKSIDFAGVVDEPKAEAASSNADAWEDVPSAHALIGVSPASVSQASVTDGAALLQNGIDRITGSPVLRAPRLG